MLRAILPAIGIAALLAVVFAAWQSHLRGRNAALSTELAIGQTQWARISAHLAEDEADRARLETFLKMPERIKEERRAPRWTPALRSLATVSRQGLENLEIEIRGEFEHPGKCSVRISGDATGETPRATAEAYRRAVQKGLEVAFARIIPVKFDQLDVIEPAGEETSTEQPLKFTISAPIDQHDAIAPTASAGF